MTASATSPVNTRRPQFLLLAALLALLLIGLLWFSKARQKGENYISLKVKTEAQATGKDPCGILAVWLTTAKLAGNKA